MMELACLFLFGGEVKALGSDCFRERQAASRRLEKWAWLTWRLCDRQWQDPEVRWRAARVVRRGALLRDPPMVAALDFTPRRWYCCTQGGAWGWATSARPRLSYRVLNRRAEIVGAELPWWLARTVAWPGRPGNSPEAEHWPAVVQREASQAVALRLQRAGLPTWLVHGAFGLLSLREKCWSPRGFDCEVFD